MKISKLIIPVAFLVGALSFVKCDYVTDPEEIPTVAAFDTTKRNAIVEEWTGHTCIACPNAARQIEDLKGIYGERFMAISIHDGFFAQSPPFSQQSCAVGFPNAFIHDYECPTAASYTAAHPTGPNSPPMGMVNRLGMPAGDEVKSRTEWDGLVDSIVQEDAICSIHIDPTYNSTTRAVGVTVHGYWLMAHGNNLNIAIMLTESGMVGWQIDGAACDSDFIFNDVVRECLNSPGSIAGTSLTTAPTVPDVEYSYTLPSAYTLPAQFNEAGCSLIAIIYDSVTGEVMQCWEEHLQ